jgi:hypothetical protein
MAGVQAGIWQNQNKPPEWLQGGEGYARRFGSAWGQIFITDTVRYGLGETMRLDVSYHKCGCTGVVPRAAHAFKEAYLARQRADARCPQFPRSPHPMQLGWLPSMGGIRIASDGRTASD